MIREAKADFVGRREIEDSLGAALRNMLFYPSLSLMVLQHVRKV